MPELRVLQNAFQSGAAHFRCLSDDELDLRRKEQRLRLAQANQTTAGDDTAPSDLSTTPPVPEIQSPDNVASGLTHADAMVTETTGPADATVPDIATPTAAMVNAHSRGADPSVLIPSTVVNVPTTSQQSLQTVFTVGGPGLVQKKPRKQRSDKGKKRGPNQRSRENNVAGTS